MFISIVIRFNTGQESLPRNAERVFANGGGLCPPKGGGAMGILTELRKFMQALASLIRALKSK